MVGHRMPRRLCITVEGYIEPWKTIVAEDEEVEEEEGEEEEEEEDDWKDMQFLDSNDLSNVSLGATIIKASSFSGRSVKIKDLRTGETYKVFGHFHFTSPWWKVTIKIYCRQNKWYLQWYPSYSLVHLGQKQISIISLFLTKCDVNPIHIKEFIEYLSRDDLEFSKVLSILQQIADEEKNENKDGFAKSIVTCISNSVEGQNVQQALKFQSLMKYLPQLLPRYFLRILKLNNTILQNLDQMIQTEMWKLGFNSVIWNFHYTKYSKEKKVFDWMFSEVQVLIVDEGSLVSVKILSTILNLLMNYANLKKLVILGDIRQLPSIEPGNMFKDMYSSLYQVGWAIELSTNHRAESRLIVDNSTKIAEMGLKSTYITLEYDAVIYLSKGIETSIPESDKKFILVSFESSSYGLQEAISLLLKWAPGLDKHETSQFIAFRRQDCAEINELCCKQYSKHLTRDHKKKLDFRVGDKVCCTRNGYVVNFIEDPNEKSGMDLDKKRVRLYNGDIFFIIEDKTEYGNFITSPTRQLKLDDRENRQILVNYEEIRKECKLVHAWARTIHTFQGSEADTVVYVVGSAGGQNWQHIYTAVTRGRQRVYVVTSEDQFIAAVTARSPRRNTRLRELLQEKLVKLGPAKCFEGLQTQQHTSCVTCTLTAPSTSLFDSSVSSSTVLPHLSSSVANGINVGTNTPSQKEDTYSEDLAFAQNYSWSPYSLELDSNESIGANERSTETVNSLRQIGDGFMSDTSAGTTGSKRIKAIWSPGSKRSVNIQADDELVPKYSKLLESPLGSTKFMMMSLASSSPSREINKRLFKEKSELGFTQEQEQHQSWNEDIS
ncbi:DNA helicase B isoform X4 [Narcine bancroftii]|uniref:DNA helicase B isoform X4 n=1 Tax=Narcine bancroftii TaxID=1343680 RepID=UPI00383118F6